MQSPEFNALYAQSLGVAAGGDPSVVLGKLIENGEHDFGSGAWFLTTQCSDVVRTGLESGKLAGWQSYISECLHTTPTPDRQAYWERAAMAMGISDK